MRNSPLEAGFRWLRQTEEDMRRTRHLAHQGANRLACFLAQQVTEKALKALLYSRGEEIVLGHSVQRLCQRAAVHDPEFEARGRSWSIVDGYCMPARYPNAPPTASQPRSTPERQRKTRSISQHTLLHSSRQG